MTPFRRFTAPLWIGLFGPAGAGKDTVAGFLTEELQGRRVAFADPVREAVLALDPLVQAPASCFDGTRSHSSPIRLSALVGAVGWETAKRESPEVRRLLQRMGTEVGREFCGERVWIRKAISEAQKDSSPVVFTDVRFPNEADTIQEFGGAVVLVTGRSDSGVPHHASETSMASYVPDCSISNTGTLEDLRKHTLATLTYLLERTDQDD